MIRITPLEEKKKQNLQIKCNVHQPDPDRWVDTGHHKVCSPPKPNKR